MTDFKGQWRCLILLVTFFGTIWCQVLNVQRCSDPSCQGVISEGRTVLKYHANSNQMLSFGQSQPVRIFSKGDGSQQDIWGVEINGKRGFANRRHLQETRVYQRNEQVLYAAPPEAQYYEAQLGGPEVGRQQQQQQQQPLAQPTVPPPAQEQPQEQPQEPQQQPQQPQEQPQQVEHGQEKVEQAPVLPEQPVQPVVQAEQKVEIKPEQHQQPPVQQQTTNSEAEQEAFLQSEPTAADQVNQPPIVEKVVENLPEIISKPDENLDGLPMIHDIHTMENGFHRSGFAKEAVSNDDSKPEVPLQLEQDDDQDILATDDILNKNMVGQPGSGLDEMTEGVVKEETQNIPELTQGDSTETLEPSVEPIVPQGAPNPEIEHNPEMGLNSEPPNQVQDETMQLPLENEFQNIPQQQQEPYRADQDSYQQTFQDPVNQEPYQDPVTQQPYRADQEPYQQTYQDPVNQEPYQDPVTQQPYQDPVLTQQAYQDPYQDPASQPNLAYQDPASQEPYQEPYQDPYKDPHQDPYHDHVDSETYNQESQEDQGLMLHYFEYIKLFAPEWLHKALHGATVDGISPELAFITGICTLVALVLVVLYTANHMVAVCANAQGLKARIGELDKLEFKARNELLILKREINEGKLNSSMNSIPRSPEVTQAPPIIKEVPSKRMLQELDNLKKENAAIFSEKEYYLSECEHLKSENLSINNQFGVLTQELTDIKGQLYQAQQELSEAESVVQECVEEKKKLTSVNSNELIKAIDTLRDQLNSQKEAVHKYEGKIKRREAELKEKTQELRKLRAETANAKLQVDKVASERDVLKSKNESLEAMETELTDQVSELQVQISVLEAVKVDLNVAKDKIDEKEAELEAVNSEVAVFKETINGLKANLANKGQPAMTNSKSSGDNGFESSDGWEVEDEVEIPNGNGEADNNNMEANFEAICDTARLKVDLQKAQSACEQLSEQLMNAEAAKEKFEAEATTFREDAELARKAKEAALEERAEATQKHQVLSIYFNQREAELQKQLGVQTQRLGEVEVDSESVSKKLNLLYDELESYKSQCKSLKQEMEEQERSLKAQNAALEKKQHESWVTVRQETRRMTEANTEMQTLRTRLTVAESKLAEKTVEIDKIMEENRAMKELMDHINNHQILKPEAIYANGGHDLPSINSSGPNSIIEEPPPELPELPLLPPAFPAFMQPAPPPMMPYPADSRPAPLGRRSPPHGGRGRRDDSRSPSPGVPYGGDNRGGRGNQFPRDVSPTPSDRSDRSSRYASSSYDYDEGRYSPPYHAPPPPRHRRRHSRDDRSPDRSGYISSRSERSDYERDYRDTPPRVGGNPGGVSSSSRRRNSRDVDYGGQDYDYQRRDKRSDRLKESRHGPTKTSSPMM